MSGIIVGVDGSGHSQRAGMPAYWSSALAAPGGFTRLMMGSVAGQVDSAPGRGRDHPRFRGLGGRPYHRPAGRGGRRYQLARIRNVTADLRGRHRQVLPAGSVVLTPSFGQFLDVGDVHAEGGGQDDGRPASGHCESDCCD
jgi:hypothetical protein